MKILLVIDDFLSSNNGTTISCRRFAQEIRRQGHEVKILGHCRTDESDTFFLPEYHLPIIGGLISANDFHFATADLSVIRQAVDWADLVHCMMPFMLTYRTLQVCQEKHKVITGAFHIQPENLLSAVRLGKCKPVVDLLYAMWRHWIYNPIPHVHCPSPFMQQELLAHRYTSHIHAISNGINDAFLLSHPHKPITPNGTITITMVGRLSREKRQDLIIKAVKQSKYAERIQIVFAGKGPLEKWYKHLGKSLPLAPKFVYLSQPQLIDLLSQTDIYVHASDMESEAISCIEAFATGLVPIISNSKKSATSQFALCSESLFQAGDAQDLAQRIDYWIDHPDHLRTMSQQYALHAQSFTLEASVKQCIAMFHQAISDQAISDHPSHQTISPLPTEQTPQTAHTTPTAHTEYTHTTTHTHPTEHTTPAFNN